jgi:predicted NBD/HSP70 family sugar kinase
MPDDDTSRRLTADEGSRHGALRLSVVEVDAYNEELRHAEGGFLGDRASSRAFTEILDDWRDRLRRGVGEDPLGEEPTEEIKRRDLDTALARGEPEAAGLVQSAVEDFAGEFAAVIRRFLRLNAWQETERIVVGGGFRESRIGELVVGRAGVMLKANGIDTDLVPIRHHPDEAGLIGAVHLLPAAAVEGCDAFLAVDIGGSNMRVGLVEPRLAKASDLSATRIRRSERWRHRDESPTREQAVAKLVAMLKGLAATARKEKLRLAPWIGIGCPGLIEEDGRISNGAQNLPGNWQSGGFNLPERLVDALPNLAGDAPTRVAMHNDAVVQGLSEVPFQQDVRHWGVLTIGTGLGNAHFTNRRRGGKRARPEA